MIFFVETPENMEKLGNKIKVIYNPITQKKSSLWY